MQCDQPNIERVLASFEHKTVDRVPNFEILIEDKHTSRVLGRTVGDTLGSSKGASEETYATPPMDIEDYIELCTLIGQDAVGMEALWAPLKIKDEEGVLHIITDGSIHTREQLDRVIPHSKELDIEPKRRYLREYIQACEGTGIGTTIMTAAAVMTPYQFIIGFEEFMIKILKDMDFIEKVISMCMDYYMDIIKMACEEGISWVYIGDDVGGKGSLLMGPDLTRKWAIPCYERIVNLCSEYDVPVTLHSCGNAVEIIPDLIDIGIVMYNPVEPTSGADIYEVSKKYGNKICISGNIDIAGPLAFGTPEDVQNDVKQHVENINPKGGYILTSSHSIQNNIPFENFMAMISAGHRYGRYPIGKTETSSKDCFATGQMEDFVKHKKVRRVEEKVFTPVKQYGICAGCGKRAINFQVPSGKMICEECFYKEGWILVREGPDRGWHKKETIN
ncbi:MAG TPA: hypothetical protein ENI15_05940 [Spirochaetes bacterium]|nr:hypothetical protein [Spirochaetota bacterium]